MNNELTVMSDAELDKAIADVKERELSLHTPSGRKYLVMKMRELIGLLETWGYKTDADENGLSILWTNGLAEEFVRLGFTGLKQAVTLWAQRDESPYRTFPKIPWIKNACVELGGDPRVEKGRRIQAEAERRLEEDHKRQMEHYKQTHPREWERIDKIAKEMEGATA